ncbi:hypothetical protein EBZ35_04310 [bacterium]|nr:hypothetical protein [bacterium]
MDAKSRAWGDDHTGGSSGFGLLVMTSRWRDVYPQHGQRLSGGGSQGCRSISHPMADASS